VPSPSAADHSVRSWRDGLLRDRCERYQRFTRKRRHAEAVASCTAGDGRAGAGVAEVNPATDALGLFFPHKSKPNSIATKWLRQRSCSAGVAAADGRLIGDDLSKAVRPAPASPLGEIPHPDRYRNLISHC
jgi:hypothetical protein